MRPARGPRPALLGRPTLVALACQTAARAAAYLPVPLAQALPLAPSRSGEGRTCRHPLGRRE